MGGQGGSTQGAGAANGVGLPQDQSVGMGLRAQEIGINMANAMSQIKLNESQANKNEAEANKISGVDTEAQKATIDNLIAQTSNEKVKKGLILGQIRVQDAEEELKRAGVDTDVQKATIDNLIAQTSNEKVKKGLILGQIRVADAEEELKRNMAD